MTHKTLKSIAIIPARHNSTRCIGKNFRPFHDTTLTDLSICCALDTDLFDHIVVSSDSPEVRRICSKYDPLSVQFIERPSDISTSLSPAIAYIDHVLSEQYKLGFSYEVVVILQPTSPFRISSEIRKAVDMIFNRPLSTSCVSLSPVDHMYHPHKWKLLDGDDLLPYLFDEGDRTSAQDLPDIYVRNGSVYVFKTDNIKKGCLHGDSPIGFVSKSKYNLDINTELDFKFAEYLYRLS